MIKYIDFHDVIECLIAAVEARDKYTCGHSTRVADITLKIAEEIGIQGAALEMIHMAAHMHDIGKIGISDEILSKPGKLNALEWDTIKQHPQIGYNILTRSNALREIADIVLYHHERWDGNGYPEGLKGEEIPLGSRIIALADSIDAMMYKRPYKQPITEQECIYQIKINKGLQFDPYLAQIAINVCFQKQSFYYTFESFTANGAK
jgi:putative nucleotidyltransferase with HDIG domain